MRLFLVSAGFLVLTTGLLADDSKPKPRQDPPDLQRLFDQFDKNKDGMLDKDEAPERIKDRFDQLDENKDGKLSREEMRKMLERFARRPGAQPPAGTPPPAGLPPMGPDFLFRALDTDGDGKLSKDELQAATKLLERLDRNKDGFLDRAELAGGPPNTTPPRPGLPGAPDIAARFGQLMKRLDTNNDGKISKEEAQGPLAENFDRIDTNKDGFLDKDEIRKSLERFMPPGGASPDRPRPPGGAPRPDASFDDLDKNVDGRLTKEEVKGTPLADKFDEIDANKDGKIDPKELEAYRKK